MGSERLEALLMIDAGQQQQPYVCNRPRLSWFLSNLHLQDSSTLKRRGS